MRGKRDYSWILALPRQVGHTAAACGKQTPDRFVVTRDHMEGDRLEREYGVKARSLDEAEDALRGKAVPVVFDLDAVQVIVSDHRVQIASLRDRLERARMALGQG